jgi:hypothetical protein
MSRPLRPTSFRVRDLERTLLANPALLQAALDAKRRKSAARRAIWETTEALSGHVRILSDPPDPELIPFEMFPYQRFVAALLDQGKSVIILKARQLGMSWLLGLYADRRAVLDGWRVGYWSLNEEAAKHELERRMLAMVDSLPEEQRVTYRKALPITEFSGKGLIQIFAATQTGGTSYTFDAAVFDEFAMHAYAETNWEHVGPTLSAGGQAIVSSTTNPSLGPNGAFYDLWTASVGDRDDWAIDESGVWTLPALSPKSLMPVFLPWDVRPGRDGAWLEEEKRRYPNMDGAAFSAWYPSTPDEAFTGREGLVYPEFSKATHVVKDDPVPWEACTYRVVGYDLGGGDPTAFVFLGAWPDVETRQWRIHQYAEWYQRRTPSAQEIHADILRPQDAIALIDFIEADPIQPTLIATLGAMCRLDEGLDCKDPQRHRWPIRKGNWARGEGIDTFRGYLASGQFTINAACVDSIAEFPSYRWAKRRDPNSKDEYATDTPVANHADAMDARRLGVLGLHFLILNSSQGQTTAYSGVRW